ncbi:DUF4926 domain-containing protein [Alkalimonas sp. NCh-2]|uniref:DUF4926 domain-containing protein n=1 Tax=Alkalimonas sp. NCh-2 TaxID=3144846 RepID=UPI0031F6EE7C
MAYTKCSRCGEEFHLRIASDDSLKELRFKEQRNEVLCLGCFKSIKEYDVVKVISENSSVPEARVGDLGAVVLVHGDGAAFEVECVLDNGSTKWIGTFKKGQVKWLQSPTN